MKFPKSFTNEFIAHLDNTESLLKEDIKDKNLLIQDFISGLEFTEASFNKKPIGEWSAQEIVSFIRELHAITSNKLYKVLPKEEKPGEFRKDISIVLRHPLKDANYNRPNQCGHIAIYLEKKFSSHIALKFLIGYLKFFVPSDIKLKNSIIQFAINRNLTLDIKNLETGLKADEQNALNMVYKIFISHEDINSCMLQWAEHFLKAIQMQQDPIEMFAIFYSKFIEIHPFMNGNSRVIEIFLNALLVEKSYQPLFLNQSSGLGWEHFFNIDKPDTHKLSEYLRKSCPIISEIKKSYEKIGYNTECTQFLQRLTQANFNSYRKRQDRFSVAAICTENEKKNISHTLTQHLIPFRKIDNNSIVVDDINSREVGPVIEQSYRMSK
jgi:hypothetical protein